MVFDPTEKPFAEEAVAVNAATPELTVPVPNVVLPSVNVTAPVIVPLALDVTFAVRATEPPNATDAGLAVTVVVVVAPADEADTLIVEEALDLLKFESPE